MTWAFGQHVPSRAKNVLFALANHADHTTGHCYPSVETIMSESSCSRRATFNFLGALQRNGFIEIRKKRGADGRQRASDYWILFEREAREWQHSGRFEEGDRRDEIEENSTDEQDSEDAALCAPSCEPVENSPLDPAHAPPQSNGCTPIYEPSDSNRQSPKLMEGPALKAQAPKEFSSQARAIEQAKLQAAEEARKPQHIFVIEDSRPWKYWTLHGGHAPTLHTWSQEHKARGWYFPTLYPQPKQSTGPPLSALMSPEDEGEFIK